MSQNVTIKAEKKQDAKKKVGEKERDVSPPLVCLLGTGPLNPCYCSSDVCQRKIVL